MKQVTCDKCNRVIKFTESVPVWNVREVEYPTKFYCKPCCKDIPRLMGRDED